MSRPGPTWAETLFELGVGLPMRLRGDEPCIGQGVDLFFPDRTNRPLAALKIKQAQAICGRCTRTAECAELARVRDERTGVWGGIDFHEPNTRRALEATGCGTVAGWRAHEAAGTEPCVACRRAHGRASRGRLATG